MLSALPERNQDERHAIGSVLLLPEILSKPTRTGATEDIVVLWTILDRLDLRPTDEAIAELSIGIAAKYKLRAADAIHLATAINGGADRFITNNAKDFRSDEITEIAITYPTDLS